MRFRSRFRIRLFYIVALAFIWLLVTIVWMQQPEIILIEEKLPVDQTFSIETTDAAFVNKVVPKPILIERINSAEEVNLRKKTKNNSIVNKTDSDKKTDLPSQSSNGFECYEYTKINKTPISLLEDVFDSPIMPTNGECIFLLETSCAKDGLIHLNPRYVPNIWSHRNFTVVLYTVQP